MRTCLYIYTYIYLYLSIYLSQPCSGSMGGPARDTPISLDTIMISRCSITVSVYLYMLIYHTYTYIYIYIYAHYNPVQATDAKPFKFNIVEFMRQDMAKGLTNKAKNVASRGYALCRKNAMEHGLSDGDARLEVDIRISHMSYICMYMYICI